MTGNEDKSDRFSPPGEAFLVIAEDGTVRRGDGKPLTEYDRRFLAAKDPMQFQLDWSREQLANAAAEAAEANRGDTKSAE